MLLQDQVERRADAPTIAAPPHPNMIWIPGGTFRMGSDRHYPEEAQSIA